MSTRRNNWGVGEVGKERDWGERSELCDRIGVRVLSVVNRVGDAIF